MITSMAGTTAVPRAEHEALVRQTAAEIYPQLEQHIADCATYIESAMPELRDDELALGLVESAGDNFRVLFAAQRDGTPLAELRAPRGAIVYADIMVRRGVPLATLLRAYRFGISFLWELWGRELRVRTRRTDLLVAALDDAMHVVFGYVDQVCDEVTEAYAVARERWNRSAAALRAETVAALLEGGDVDVDAASRRLGYDLHRHHVAFVLGAESQVTDEDTDENVMDRLEAAGMWLAGALGCGRPLLVPRGFSELWMWVGFMEAPAGEALGELCGVHPELRGIAAACGEPAEHHEGFRASHEEAQHAARMAKLSERPLGRVERYGHVVVPSLLLTDTERARAFVRRELGALAAPGEATERIRATLLLFLESRSRTSTTAKRLGVHDNTVVYRLRRAEALLGHPIAERRFEVESALRLLRLGG